MITELTKHNDKVLTLSFFSLLVHFYYSSTWHGCIHVQYLYLFIQFFWSYTSERRETKQNSFIQQKIGLVTDKKRLSDIVVFL